MIIKKQFGSYDPARYGVPRGAKVTFRRGRPKYQDCVELVGDPGEAGVVTLDVERNDTVAFGQKDSQGDNTVEVWYIVGEDGELIETTQEAALDYSTRCREAAETVAQAVSLFGVGSDQARRIAEIMKKVKP